MFSILLYTSRLTFLLNSTYSHTFQWVNNNSLYAYRRIYTLRSCSLIQVRGYEPLYLVSFNQQNSTLVESSFSRVFCIIHKY